MYSEPMTSLENCDITRGRIYHTDECTCTAEDIEAWYDEKAQFEWERSQDTDNAYEQMRSNLDD